MSWGSECVTTLHHHKLKIFQPAPLKIKRMEEIENCYDSETLQLPIQIQLHTKAVTNDSLREFLVHLKR